MKKCWIIFLLLLSNFIILNSASLSIKLEKTLGLSGNGDGYFIGKISSVAVDDKEHIYILDRKMNSILKFNKNGKFLKKCGRKGEGPGEFPQDPKLIKYSKDKLYVALAYGFPKLYVFDTNLSYLKSINNRLYITDFFVKNSHIYLPCLVCKGAFTINIIDNNGKLLTNSNTKIKMDEEATTKQFDDKFKTLTVDNDGNMYIASYYQDKIEKWNKNYVKIWSKYIFTGNKNIHYKKVEGTIRVDSNKSYYYSDIQIDNKGRLYILSGITAKNKAKDVYVISKTGELITIFTLPNVTMYIKIDNNNNIYSNGSGENEMLIKNKLHFSTKKINFNSKGYPAIKKGGMLFEYMNKK